VTQKNQTNKVARGRASEENAATRKEKRRKHGRKQELRKKHNTQKRHSQKKPLLPPHKAQLGGGGGEGEGAVLFLVPKKITFTTFSGQLLPNCIYPQF
jgi:hypothetical protein